MFNIYVHLWVLDNLIWLLFAIGHTSIVFCWDIFCSFSLEAKFFFVRNRQTDQSNIVIIHSHSLTLGWIHTYYNKNYLHSVRNIKV